jgi:NADH:ubiquinone oxidoreductase subunit
MKKCFFIFPVIACMLAISNVKAQNTPIDDFLKKYPSREGVTSVSISQQMLQGIFTRPKTYSSSITPVWSFWVSHKENFNVPESYSSVSISRANTPENLYADFKRKLLSSKYEQYMEVNRENSDILLYLMKKGTNIINEIVVLRHQKDQFSAIYIKGVIDVSQVDNYLQLIKLSLDQQLSANQTNMFQPEHQFDYDISSHNFFRIPVTDSIMLHWLNDPSKNRVEESMEKMKQIHQRNIQESIKKMRPKIEETQSQDMEQ